MNAAQRARKRWKRERRMVPVDEPAPERTLKTQFHRFYLRTTEKADELAAGLAARGRHVQKLETSGPLRWRVLMKATEAEMLDPGHFIGKYQEFAVMFGGEYGGLA